MTDSGMLILATFGGYLASLVLLVRWFAASDASHVLPIEVAQPVPRVGAGARWRAVLRVAAALGTAATVLAIEIRAFAYVGSWILGVSCQESWLPVPDCSLEAEPGHPGRGTALAILIGCAASFAVARRLMSRSAFYPATILMLAIVAFGAASDLVAGGAGADRQQIVFRLAAGLQLTAAAALAFGFAVLRAPTVAAVIRCLFAHMAGAWVRILAAVLMLSLWPNLPAASAIALLAGVMLLPGVVSALTAAAVLASTHD